MESEPQKIFSPETSIPVSKKEDVPSVPESLKDSEKLKAYDQISDDPAYREMQTDITRRTNLDSQVQSASDSGQDFRSTWNKVNNREHIHAIYGFARQYPEKAQAYTNRWDSFVAQHPEITDMNNAQWDAWCDKNPGAYASIDEYRDVARAVNHVKTKKEMDNKQPQIQETEKKLAKIRENLGISEIPMADLDAPISKDKEKLNILQLKDVISSIRTNIPSEIQSASTESLQAMQKELTNLPYIPVDDIAEILNYGGENEGVMMVDTDAIMGSVSAKFKDWSTEYESRKGRIVDVAQGLMKGTEESVDNVFHVKDPEQGVKLKKISGPEGDLFFVVDGTHRVASSKLVQLPQIPAKVENITNLSEVRTTDPILKSEWEGRIRRGLMSGNIKETTTNSGQKIFNLKIDSQVLPWMTLPQNKFIKMTKFYLRRYPGSLDKMTSFTTGKKIPKEAFLDEIAMNFYLAGRWEEYKPS